MQQKKKICFVVTCVMSVEAFLLGHIAALSGGYEVCLITNCRDRNYLRKRGLDAEVIHVPIARDISPVQDFVCLIMLAWIFRRRKFDLVHSLMPKTGLLGMLAARLACVRVRIHTFTGQLWATRSGFRRFALRRLDRVTASCATQVLADSKTQMDFLVSQGVVPQGKGSVLANGSVCGVDIARFRPRPELRDKTRASLAIPEGATVFSYVGRLRREKGTLDLAAAFALLCRTHPAVYLIIAGPDEENLQARIEVLYPGCRDRLRFIGYTETPELYMECADVLCLPSYREGFGSVLIEAAACGIPSLASRIYGVVDAVVEGVTGVLHAPGSVEQLEEGMRRFVDDPAGRIEMGRRARTRAMADFNRETVSDALQQCYAQLLKAAADHSVAAPEYVRT